MNQHYALSQYNHKGVCGYLARYYGREKTLTKLFNVNYYGGYPATYAAARRWLQEQLKLYPISQQFRTTPLPHKRNSLPAGICLRKKKDPRRSHDGYWSFDVSWAIEGRRYTKSFYAHKYDTTEEALTAAIQFRKQKEQEMEKARLERVQRCFMQEE